MFPVAEERSTPCPYPVKLIPLPDPLSPLRNIFPVVDPPRVRFWKLVVLRLPVPLRNVLFAPLLADMEAVGVPEFTLITANLAEEVDVPPRAKSRVELIG